jgi:hypothetical protein
MATAAKKPKNPQRTPANKGAKPKVDAAPRQAAIARLVTQVADLQLRIAQVYEALLALQQPSAGFETGGISDRNNVRP